MLASGLIGHFSSSTGMWVASQCNADRPSGTAKQHTPGPRDPLPYLLSPHSHPVALFPILLLCLLHHPFIYLYSLESVFLSRIKIQSLLIHLHTRSEDQTPRAIMQYSKFAVIAALAAPLASAQNLSGLPTCAVRFYTSRTPPTDPHTDENRHRKPQPSLLSAAPDALSQTSPVSATSQVSSHPSRLRCKLPAAPATLPVGPRRCIEP